MSRRHVGAAGGRIIARLALSFVLSAGAAGVVDARPLRVMSLDQCADQYMLALAPNADLILSPRADDPDAWLRAQAAGHRRARPTLEAAIGARPDVVVRYWGGDERLLMSLERLGARTVTIEDVADVEGVRRDIRTVAAALDRSAGGEALIAGMDRKLAATARPTAPEPALYLTAGGFTAGPGTLIDAVLRAAGVINLSTTPGFGPYSVERMAMSPPRRLVLGFFDLIRSDWRGPGRHPVVRRAAARAKTTRLPAAVLTCPAWFVGDAAEMIAGAGR